MTDTTIDLIKPDVADDEYDEWVRLGWTDTEIHALQYVHEHVRPDLVRARDGSRRKEHLFRVVDSILGDDGLTQADYDAWVRGQEPRRLGYDVELSEGQTLVKLPADYDDLRDRSWLVARLNEKVGPGAQVETIVPCGDGSRSAAVAVRGEPSWQPLSRIVKIPDDRRDSDAARTDAELRRDGETLLGWDYDAHRQLVGRLAPFELNLRDQIADHLQCPKWQVRLSTTWTVEDGVGILASVRIESYPLITDPLLRQRKWQSLIDQIRPVAPNASWRIHDDTANRRLRLERAADPLSEKFTLAEFEDRYRPAVQDPWTSWSKFPVAVRENGDCVTYTTFHTLVVGQTGAGKGSVLWSVLSGMIPAAREGLVEFYAIDPKNAEAKVGEGHEGRPNALFERVATTPDDWAELLEDMVADMKARQAQSGRSFKISKERPLRIVFVDELSALSTFDNDRQRAAGVEANLMLLLSQGRSDGIILIAAVQAPQKDMVGRLRQFFAMRIALRTETAIETDLVLGNGAVDQGALAHAIEPANAGNAYRTAGTGYMRVEGEAAPVRVRFPYTTDEDLEAWSDEWATRGDQPQVIQHHLTMTIDDLDVPDDPDEADAPIPDDGVADDFATLAELADGGSETSSDGPPPGWF